MRWEDPVRQFVMAKGEIWQEAAKDRDKWESWEDEFAARRWHGGGARLSKTPLNESGAQAARLAITPTFRRSSNAANFSCTTAESRVRMLRRF